MRKQQVQSTEYVLDEKDVQVIKDALNYCYHRIAKHGKTALDLDQVQRLRKEFGIIPISRDSFFYTVPPTMTDWYR